MLNVASLLQMSPDLDPLSASTKTRHVQLVSCTFCIAVRRACTVYLPDDVDSKTGSPSGFAIQLAHRTC